MNEYAEDGLHDAGLAITALEVAAWAAMRAIFESCPAASFIFAKAAPALLSGMSGPDAEEVKVRAELHIKRWAPNVADGEAVTEPPPGFDFVLGELGAIRAELSADMAVIMALLSSHPDPRLLFERWKQLSAPSDSSIFDETGDRYRQVFSERTAYWGNLLGTLAERI